MNRVSISCALHQGAQIESKKTRRKLIFQRRSEKTQLELEIDRKIEPDRHFFKGGRSFYFFDFDDNVAFLSTPAFIFHKESGEEKVLSSGQFALQHKDIGHTGAFKDYQVDFNPEKGTFRRFRDRNMSWLERIVGKRQTFIEDLWQALGEQDIQWKGPSWDCFYHAVFNRRPVSVITARGHYPETIKKGIQLFRECGHVPNDPNYLSVYPVTHPETQKNLGFEIGSPDIPRLKQAAIRASVLKAIEIYGESPYHRFGMSDDDPKNIELITEEMIRLKKEFKDMSFFVFKTSHGEFVKTEVFANHLQSKSLPNLEQLQLF